jgi:hypothetical protein
VSRAGGEASEGAEEVEMVGSGAAAGGGGDHARSKEAAGMMALHEALRNVCLSSDWTYSVFWTIRPRPYVFLLPVVLSPIPLATSSSTRDLSCFASVPSGQRTPTTNSSS